MTQNPSRKSVMTLYSAPNCIMGHCARLVMLEKNVPAEIEYFDPEHPSEDLLDLNPLGNSPTFVERDLVLYDARIIMEYLDERFPHPALHPMDPGSRATARMLIKRIDQDWYSLLHEIEQQGEKKAIKAKKYLKESLMAASPAFDAHQYFMTDEYTIIDCVMAPFLWRLPNAGIEILPLGNSIATYANLLFSRKAFQDSLSNQERALIASSSK